MSGAPGGAPCSGHRRFELQRLGAKEARTPREGGGATGEETGRREGGEGRGETRVDALFILMGTAQQLQPRCSIAPWAWRLADAHRHTRLGSWLGYTLQKDLFQFVIRVLVFSVLCTLLPALVYFREIGVSCDKERSSTSVLTTLESPGNFPKKKYTGHADRRHSGAPRPL